MPGETLAPAEAMRTQETMSLESLESNAGNLADWVEDLANLNSLEVRRDIFGGVDENAGRKELATHLRAIFGGWVPERTRITLEERELKDGQLVQIPVQEVEEAHYEPGEIEKLVDRYAKQGQGTEEENREKAKAEIKRALGGRRLPHAEVAFMEDGETIRPEDPEKANRAVHLDHYLGWLVQYEHPYMKMASSDSERPDKMGKFPHRRKVRDVLDDKERPQVSEALFSSSNVFTGVGRAVKAIKANYDYVASDRNTETGGLTAVVGRRKIGPVLDPRSYFSRRADRNWARDQRIAAEKELEELGPYRDIGVNGYLENVSHALKTIEYIDHAINKIDAPNPEEYNPFFNDNGELIYSGSQESKKVSFEAAEFVEAKLVGWKLGEDIDEAEEDIVESKMDVISRLLTGMKEGSPEAINLRQTYNRLKTRIGHRDVLAKGPRSKYRLWSDTVRGGDVGILDREENAVYFGDGSKIDDGSSVRMNADGSEWESPKRSKLVDQSIPSGEETSELEGKFDHAFDQWENSRTDKDSTAAWSEGLVYRTRITDSISSRRQDINKLRNEQETKQRLSERIEQLRRGEGEKPLYQSREQTIGVLQRRLDSSRSDDEINAQIGEAKVELARLRNKYNHDIMPKMAFLEAGREVVEPDKTKSKLGKIAMAVKDEFRPEGEGRFPSDRQIKVWPRGVIAAKNTVMQTEDGPKKSNWLLRNDGTFVDTSVNPHVAYDPRGWRK